MTIDREAVLAALDHFQPTPETDLLRRNRLAQAIESYAAQLTKPRYLHIVAELLVHDRRDDVDGVRCPCCGSADAEIVERRTVVDLFVDTVTGERILERDVNAKTWAQLGKVAELHHVPLRCSVKALPAILDETGRHIFASGGNRASKTTTGLVWFALMLLRFGGAARRFWLVASTGEKAFRLLEKLFRPTPSPSGGTVPPILPAALVVSAPATHRASDQLTTLIDGSVIDLRFFHNDPGAERAKADPIVAGLVDEAAHLPGAWLPALKGRCVDLSGRLWLASTATPSSSLNELVEKLQEWRRWPDDHPLKLSGAHDGAAWRFEMFPMLANPWLNHDGVLHSLRTVDMSNPQNRRDFLGEWCASEGLCWTNFDTERHVVAHEARRVRNLSAAVLARHGAGGHVDITGRVSRALFGRTNPHHKMARASVHDFIIGQDVNLNPMSSALLQITAPQDMVSEDVFWKAESRDSWHYWIVDTVSTATSNSLAHAERLVSTELARVLDPDGKGSPLRGCGVIVDATAIGRDPTARAHGQSGSVVETFWRAGLDARAPLYRPNQQPGKPGHYNGEVLGRFTLMHRLINEGRFHVFSRAGELLHAFAVQLATPDGVVPMDSRRGKWDAIMGPMDATSYVILAAANAKPPAAARDWASLPAA